MKRLGILLALAALPVCAAPPAAMAEGFGIHGFDVTYTEANGATANEAGKHPYAMTTSFEANVEEVEGKKVPVEPIKDVFAFQVPGLAGSPVAVPPCSTLDFLTINQKEGDDPNVPACDDSSAVGKFVVVLEPAKEGKEAETDESPVFLLDAAPGTAAKIGWYVKGVPVSADVGVTQSPPYRIVGHATNITQIIAFYGADLTLWGNPASEAHDEERGHCYKGGKACPAAVTGTPFLTLPRACTGPLQSSYATDSWPHPGPIFDSGEPDLTDSRWVTGSAATHDDLGNPQGMIGCGQLDFAPRVAAHPSTDQASSPSGLAVSLDVTDEGLANPTGTAASDIQKVVFTLPPGMTANPSVAEGLKACSPADLDRESVGSAPGAGCPEASKVGSVAIETPLLPGATLHGSLYVATPFENPFHTLIALYMVIKDTRFGVMVKQPFKVEPDPRTGQLITTGEDLPQFPLAHVEVRLREGGRGLLISPPGCGSFDAVAQLTPWSDPSSPLEATSTFQIDRGPGGGACPPPGRPPFVPGFTAGSLDNTAGTYSPFFLRLTRRDGDQDIVRFDATLPPGVTAKLTGVAQCPDSAIAAARAKSGHDEQANPSCPAGSQIGRVEGGAGVGSELTYVPGRLYLAGPVGSAPLSVVAIVPAVAGPYDVGNIVVRQALRVNPRSGVVSADSSASDEIPHILAGIPLAVRDIRVFVDRPDFTLNPTGCQPTGTQAGIWGGGSDPFSTTDDGPVFLAAPYQAASCGSLGFQPRLSLELRGGSKRGAFPALRGVYRPRPGDANLKKLVVRLPHSAFLEQGHFGTICTRVQYAANACPAKAIYGHVRAFTPLLSQPLKGPVFLRSSNHNLPDLVASLHGTIDVEAVARIDSIHGGIRTTFTGVPDAPLEKVVLDMRGGEKGLIVNSTNLCQAKHRALLRAEGHNAAAHQSKPLVRSTGCKRKRSRHRRAQGFQ